jgi:hypothetical protein
MDRAVMTRGRARRALALAGAAALAAGCAAAPLPSMRPLSHQGAQELAWDSRTCAWAAEDASGYWADLSPQENAIMGAFTWGPVRERSLVAPAPVATPETVGPASPSPSHLGQGGRRRFEDVYSRCMRARGYEFASRAAEDNAR